MKKIEIKMKERGRTSVVIENGEFETKNDPFLVFNEFSGIEKSKLHWIREDDIEGFTVTEIETSKEQCSNCRYWKADERTQNIKEYPDFPVFGYCRRRAPILKEWPGVMETDYCGEYEDGKAS